MTYLRRDNLRRPTRGFTLTEILIVIGIIVLMLALAVPALNFIRGSRSIDGAENQMSALLGRARSRAIGVQELTGVFFFHDPNTDRDMAAIVHETPALNGPGPNVPVDNADVDVYLDMISDQEYLALPEGVSVQVVDDCKTTVVSTSTVRLDDGYIGFNTKHGSAGSDETVAGYGGVILFDSSGKLVSRYYAFRIAMPDGTGNMHYTQMGRVLFNRMDLADADVTDPTLTTPPSSQQDVIPVTVKAGPPANPVEAETRALRFRSQFGFVLFDREAFVNATVANPTPGSPTAPTYKATINDPVVITGMTNNTTAYTATGDESGEEQWLDDNSTPMLINRYNGTLIKGE